MLLSIIVPTYNCNKNIKTVIDELISIDSCPTEIILIDDGSASPSSIKILKNIEKKYKNLKVFYHDHAGVGAGRNFGIRQSQGDYITFIDDDDIIYPETYSELINIAKCMPDIDVFSASVNVTPGHSLRKFKNKKSINAAVLSTLQINNDVFNSNEFPAGPYAKLIKRSVLIEHNIFFPTDIFNGEDLIFNSQVLLKSRGFFLLRNNVYKYRQNPNSLMNKYFPELYLNNKRFLNYIFEIINQLRVNDPDELIFYWKIRLSLTNILRQHSVHLENKVTFINDVNIIKGVLRKRNVKTMVNENFSHEQVFLIYMIALIPRKLTLLSVRLLKKMKEKHKRSALFIEI